MSSRTFPTSGPSAPSKVKTTRNYPSNRQHQPEPASPSQHVQTEQLNGRQLEQKRTELLQRSLEIRAQLDAELAAAEEATLKIKELNPIGTPALTTTTPNVKKQKATSSNNDNDEEGGAEDDENMGDIALHLEDESVIDRYFRSKILKHWLTSAHQIQSWRKRALVAETKLEQLNERNLVTKMKSLHMKPSDYGVGVHLGAAGSSSSPVVPRTSSNSPHKNKPSSSSTTSLVRPSTAAATAGGSSSSLFFPDSRHTSVAAAADVFDHHQVQNPPVPSRLSSNNSTTVLVPNPIKSEEFLTHLHHSAELNFPNTDALPSAEVLKFQPVGEQLQMLFHDDHNGHTVNSKMLMLVKKAKEELMKSLQVSEEEEKIKNATSAGGGTRTSSSIKAATSSAGTTSRNVNPSDMTKLIQQLEHKLDSCRTAMSKLIKQVEQDRVLLDLRRQQALLCQQVIQSTKAGKAGVEKVEKEKSGVEKKEKHVKLVLEKVVATLGQLSEKAKGFVKRTTGATNPAGIGQDPSVRLLLGGGAEDDDANLQGDASISALGDTTTTSNQADSGAVVEAGNESALTSSSSSRMNNLAANARMSVFDRMAKELDKPQKIGKFVVENLVEELQTMCETIMVALDSVASSGFESGPNFYTAAAASSGTTNNLGITLGGSLPAQLQGVGNLNGSSLFPPRTSRSAAAAATANYAYLQYYPPVALEREQHQQEAASLQETIDRTSTTAHEAYRQMVNKYSKGGDSVVLGRS